MKRREMSVVLLVGLKESSSLYRVSTTYEGKPFKVWKGRDELELFWRGRRVSRVYSLGESGDCWQKIPLYNTIMTLLERGKAKRVKYMPETEGELPI